VTVADAVDNALNTLLAVITLDARVAQGKARIVTRQVSGVTVKTLDPPIALAYAVDRLGNRLVLGSSPAAVARYLSAGSDSESAGRFRKLQTLGFPNADSFLCLDVAAVRNEFSSRRERLIEKISKEQNRSRDDVAHDVEQVLALSQLFDAAYLANRVDSNSASIFHTFGLLPRRSATELRHSKR
jgi:hypothetical protein